MNILILGPKRLNLKCFIEANDDKVLFFEDRLDTKSSVLNQIDFIISYGYRHIVPEAIIKRFNKRIINLHISYLPWNRGSDPNLWSFLENTPKGVTIHFMDKGLDTGDIIVQETISIYDYDTLTTTYDRLTKSVESLLFKYWGGIKKEKILGTPQEQNGSSHKLRDKQPYLYLLTNGWDTPVKEIIGKALEGEDKYYERDKPC